MSMKRTFYFISFITLLLTVHSVFGEERETLVRQELYFDGYSHSVRVFIDPSSGFRPERIGWYRGRLTSGGYIDIENFAPGDECFTLPGENTWIGCIIRTRDGDLINRTVRISERIPEREQTGLPEVYLTFPRPGMTVNLEGSLVSIKQPGEKSAVLVGAAEDHLFYRLDTPGFYSFTVNSFKGPSLYNVFVSPVESVHTERIDRDWYYTQFRTTTTSNCGPTVVSMGIAWASGQDVPVSKVREIVGWVGSGAVNFHQMKQVLDRYGIRSWIENLTGADQIFSAIDNDRMVGVLYDMSGVSYQNDPGTNMFDQYYRDKGGHYLAVKGYTKDKKYLIIYDPIPSDWRNNSKRYSDGISMYGRNRYYRVDELLSSLRSNQILIIERNPDETAALVR